MLRSDRMLSHRDIVLRTVFRANKISLRPEGVISLSQSENITLCTAKNITKKAEKERASRNFVTALLSLLFLLQVSHLFKNAQGKPIPLK